METDTIDIQSRFVKALRTQPSHKPNHRLPGPLPCPFGHSGRIFQDFDQLLGHTKIEHSTAIEGLNDDRARITLREAVIRQRRMDGPPEATTGVAGTPDISGLNLDSDKERQTSPSSGKKRRAESEFRARRGKVPSHVEVVDPEFSRDIPYTNPQADPPEKPGQRSQDSRLFNYKKILPAARSLHSATPPQQLHSEPSAPVTARRPGLIELQKYDPRYPGLLLQPDSRPISQEQLASEVKSIYAGLTMVETKCMHVDRTQAAIPHDPTQKLVPDHWQALIALHRTLLHEHHDFFLASQHPSASPALRRLAAKYTMPARMWKHGIHAFLELLRRHLPDSLDYMLAFIYLAYQMMALLYETVPAFEDTWIECLGDLGRYRMAIEDEDIKDRETWANVARSWYTKAADRNPPVGRLYHHLAILARPNALHQLYYYGRSLNSVEPFPSARESIMTLFDPILGRVPSNISTALPIDASFIKAHAYTFERDSTDKYGFATHEYLGQLDNHIGRVTAKWKEQGVYTAVTNIASWFDYGFNTNIFRQLFLLRAAQRKDPNFVVEVRDTKLPPDPDLQKPRIPEEELEAQLHALQSDLSFSRATRLTNDTFSLVLRRIGDKNVLPHVHTMLSFLSTFASVEYVAHFIDNSPWADIAAFLNTLIKTETQQNHGADINASICQPVFPSDSEAQKQEDSPLPEDYLTRGLIWAEEFFPAGWFEREHDEEDRYLELASTAKRRADRVLRLGYKLSTVGDLSNCFYHDIDLSKRNRWISYDKEKHTFASTKVQ